MAWRKMGQSRSLSIKTFCSGKEMMKVSYMFNREMNRYIRGGKYTRLWKEKERDNRKTHATTGGRKKKLGRFPDQKNQFNPLQCWGVMMMECDKLTNRFIGEKKRKRKRIITDDSIYEEAISFAGSLETFFSFIFPYRRRRKSQEKFREEMTIVEFGGKLTNFFSFLFSLSLSPSPSLSLSSSWQIGHYMSLSFVISRSYGFQ